MIPADGEFYAHFKSAQGDWPAVAKKVLAWDDQGRPMVLGAKGLVSADSIDGLVLTAVREAPAPVRTIPPAPTSVAQNATMDRRSWYMTQESAEALGQALHELHHALRVPKHVVLAEIVAVALDHLPEVGWRLQLKDRDTATT